MTKLKKAIAVVFSIILGLIAFFLGKRKLSNQEKKPDAPPNNKAADVALDTIQKTFKEEVDRIKTATTSNTPADNLADLGNARKR